VALRGPEGRIWRDGEALPEPGPTDHGLGTLGLALGQAPGARALVACPPPVRRHGDWDFELAPVAEALAWLEEAAGTGPLVVLLPWEWHAGPGDGTHPLGPQLTQLLTRPHTWVVAPTGNRGDRPSLWNLVGPTRISWTPDGVQVLQLWRRGGEADVVMDGGKLCWTPAGSWLRCEVHATGPVTFQVTPGVGATVRLRPPAPSTAALACEPAAESLGSVGFPACHPQVVAVGTDHWTSARGLGGPDVLGPWSARTPVRADRTEACDLFAERRGASIAAAVHAGRLLAACQDLENR
jgi:hypothetical protein